MEMMLEIIKILGIALGSAFASSGIVMYYIKKHDRVAQIEKKFDRLSEGITLSLENDAVIFEALRKGHINGESEAQDHKMKDYFFKNSVKGFQLNHEGDSNNDK